jgi:hypothetical protein
MDDRSGEPVARLIEVARQLGLAVDQDRTAARVFEQVDMIHATFSGAVMRDVEALVRLAFAVHARATLRFAHQRGKTMLQHAGADAPEDVRAAVFLQDDGLDALQVQKLGEQESGRAPADNADRGLHRSLPSSWINLRGFIT